MFDIGFGELLVCAIVALVVLGPEKLPGAVRTIGRWIGRARHTVNQFSDQIDREIRADEMKKRIEAEMKKAGVEKNVMDDVTRQINDALRAPLPLVGADHLRDPGNTIAPPATAAASTAPAANAAAPATEIPAPEIPAATPATTSAVTPAGTPAVPEATPAERSAVDKHA